MASFTDVTTLPPGSFDQYEDKGNLAESILGAADRFLNYKKDEASKEAASKKQALDEARKRELEDRKYNLEERKVASDEKKNNATIVATLGGTKKDKSTEKADAKAYADAMGKLKSDTSNKIKVIDDRMADLVKTLDVYGGSSDEEKASARETMNQLKTERKALETELAIRTTEWEKSMEDYKATLKNLERVKKDPKSTDKDIEEAEGSFTKAQEKLRTISIDANGLKFDVKGGGPETPMIPSYDPVVKKDLPLQKNPLDDIDFNAPQRNLDRLRGMAGIPVNSSIVAPPRGSKPLTFDILAGSKPVDISGIAQQRGFTPEVMNSLPNQERSIIPKLLLSAKQINGKR